MVLTEFGEMPGIPSGKLYYEASQMPVVGDWVVAQILDEQPKKAILHAVLPRKSKFSRKEAGKRTSEQAIAANVDTLFLVIGLDGNFSLRRIERYLTLAWESGAQPVVLLTKADVCDDLDQRLAEVHGSAPGVQVHAVSVYTGSGLDQLDQYLTEGTTIALIGSSGVGKSTLTNHLLGQTVQKVRDVREMDSKGRHTTTHRQMFILPSGALLIDTPGMRELQLWCGDESIGGAFPDIDELARDCRFSDCRHTDEPGCRVRQALEEGTLDSARFDNYCRMLREVQYLERRQESSAAVVERQKWKKIHKQIKDLYKH